MSKIPVIIDTDPGVDDFIAIMLANSMDELDIRAITTVAGNQTLEITTKNALDIAEFLSIETRIAKGAQSPLNKPLTIANKVHGDSGIGPVKLKDSSKKLDKYYAWDVIYQEAIKNNGKINIVAIGPLTNIAIALLKYDTLYKYIEKITIMGGSTGTGNITPYSEFNIYVDPFAADIVFKSGVPIKMVGLNVTMQTVLTQDLVKDLKQIDSKINTEVSMLLDHMANIYNNFGYNFVAVHDALTVASVAKPEILEYKDFYVTVETREGLSEGRTVVDLDRSHRKENLNAKVALSGNTDMFVDILKEMMKFYN
ncbi:MAG: nucleoside hydrolase [Filifactoraceae bacterium]